MKKKNTILKLSAVAVMLTAMAMAVVRIVFFIFVLGLSYVIFYSSAPFWVTLMVQVVMLVGSSFFL